MLLSTLFSLSADLSLVDVRLEDEGLTLVLRSSQTNAMCPECAQPSTHVHGHYTRRLADLPCQKRPVRVCLEVCRFACARVRPSNTATSRGPHGDRLRAGRQSGGAVGEAPGNARRSRYEARGSSAALRSRSARPRRCWDSTISPGKKATATARCWSICKPIVRSRSCRIGKPTPSSEGLVRIGA